MSVNPAEQLTEEQIAEFREVFNLYDKTGEGAIVATELGTVMRCLGLNPTRSELDSMINEVDVNGDGLIDFEEEFLPLMSRKLQDIDDEDELCEMFKEFDVKTSGHISVLELRHLMTELGEKMTEEEVDNMICETVVDADGMIEYRELIRLLLTPSKD
eukprot:TRINITY_DN11503_c0_g1_i1.p1 TRINITY_DN11503_c0_g1~~TRINITY_DN11503_c0_g1_i1.p1  ORF type:complete len:158 (+),score=55.88 TRINITY_DN11503_c0_g1_i1:133-606(+)